MGDRFKLFAQDQGARENDFVQSDYGVFYIPYAKLRSYQKDAADSPNPLKRISAVMTGYGPDRLIADPDPDVRKAVARYGFGLDILAHDEDESVRECAKRVLQSLGSEPDGR